MEKFTGYMSHAWGDLKQDKRWWQPMLIFTLVSFIPIIGPMIVAGYFYDWAKEASWGLTKPLTRKVGDVGRRLKYGFFAVIIGLVWTVPVSIVAGILGLIPFLGGLFALVGWVAALAAGIVAEAATLRALTYERIAPAFQFSRILKMAQRDMGGLLRCFGIAVLGGVIVMVILFAVIIPMGVAGAFAALAGSGAIDSSGMGYDYGGFSFGYDGPDIYGYDGYNMPYPNSATAVLVGMILAALPALLIVGLIASFVGVLFTALSTRAYGYWLGQFKPNAWGTPDDSMPFEREGMPGGAAATPQAPPFAEQPAAGQSAAGAGQPASSTTAPDRSAQERPQGAGAADTCDPASASRNEGSTAPAVPDESCADVPNPGAVERGFVEDGYQAPQEIGGAAVSGSERAVLDAASGEGDAGDEDGATGWRSASNAAAEK